jgi:hypothetical protein
MSQQPPISAHALIPAEDVIRKGTRGGALDRDLMQLFRLAAREVKPHCDAAPTQAVALQEFAERLRKEGWKTREVDLLVAAIRRLVLARPAAPIPV